MKFNYSSDSSSHQFRKLLNLSRKQSITSIYEFSFHLMLKTNIPIDEIINIICSWVYKHTSIFPPKMKLSILQKLRHACTTKILFYGHNRIIYTHRVSMDSPLGTTFSNYFKPYDENNIFRNVAKPKKYIHYVDDISIPTKNLEKIF